MFVYRLELNCVAVPGFYKEVVSNEPCLQCQGKTTIGPATTLEADCICNAGFMLGETGECVQCKVTESARAHC